MKCNVPTSVTRFEIWADGVEIFSWDDTGRESRPKPSMRIMCCGIEAVVYWARSKTRYISNEEIGTPGGLFRISPIPPRRDDLAAVNFIVASR